jgi:hypothetical protein
MCVTLNLYQFVRILTKKRDFSIKIFSLKYAEKVDVTKGDGTSLID